MSKKSITVAKAEPTGDQRTALRAEREAKILDEWRALPDEDRQYVTEILDSIRLDDPHRARERIHAFDVAAKALGGQK